MSIISDIRVPADTHFAWTPDGSFTVTHRQACNAPQSMAFLAERFTHVRRVIDEMEQVAIRMAEMEHDAMQRQRDAIMVVPIEDH